MNPFQPSPSRLVVLISAYISATIATTARAQEYSPVVEDRVEDGIVVEPLVPAVVEKEKPATGLEIRAMLSAAYDSNIYFSRSNPQSDTIYRIAPSVAYTQGDAKEGEGGFVQFAYRPTGVVYSRHGGEDRIDHEAAVTAGWKGKLSKVTYTGAIQKLGDATADTGRPTDRLFFENELRFAWIPKEKITLEAAVGNRQTDYIAPTYFDSKKIYGELAARYAYSPKTEIGLAYQVGTFEVDGASKQHTQQVTVQFAWQPREKIRLNLEVGAEDRKTANGSEVNPVLEGRLDWTPREGTELYLAAYQREEASAFFAGQNYSVKGGTVGVSQKLGRQWTARLEGGRESSVYNQVAGSGSGGRKDKMWFVKPSLEYQVNDNLGVSLFYRISDNSSTSGDFGYDQKTGGVELNYRF